MNPNCYLHYSRALAAVGGENHAHLSAGKLPADGSQPEANKAIAYGFIVSRQRSTQVSGQEVTSEERLLVVRSLSYLECRADQSEERLAKQKRLCATDAPATGRA